MMYNRFFALVLVALFFYHGRVYAQDGCYYPDVDGVDGAQPMANVAEIDVYTTDAFYSNAIGSPAFSSTERDHMVRSFLYNFQWQTGNTTHYNWKGNVNNPELGRHVTIGDCDATPYSFVKPTLVINADSTTCSSPALMCAWVQLYPVTGGRDTMNCARITFASSAASSFADAHTVKRLFGHEVLHTWKMSHQNTGGCGNNSDVCLICDGSASVDTHFLTRAERSYIRTDSGYASFDVIENHGSGFPPAAWLDTTVETGTHSGGRTTDSDDADSGYIYNVVGGGGQPEARVLTVESDSWLEEDIPNSDSYYLPDIAKTVNQSTEKWFAAFFVGDSATTTDKDIDIFERDVASGTWTERYLDSNHLLPYLTITYDPISDKMVIVTERNGGLRFYTRSRTSTGGSWTFSTFSSFASYDGVDVACSKYNSAPSTTDNCVLVYVNTAATGSVKFRRMRVDGSGAVSVGSENHAGFVGYSRPSVTVNPLNADPQFLFSFNQGGTTTYVRKMDRGSTTWSGTGVTSFVAGSPNWMGPGSLGVFRAGGTTYVDLMANED